MVQRRTLLFAAGGIGLAILAALVVIGPGDFFLPEQSTTVDEEVSDAEVLKRGTFVGTDHDVSGNVSLVHDEEGLLLRFENYRQQQGPDVFIFVTPSGTPDSGSEVDAGLKVRIDGGEDGGESTVQGTFEQRLPRNVSASDVNGVGAWCERFGVPFGYATLEPA